MPRSASVSVPRRDLYVVPERRASLELEDALLPSSSIKNTTSEPREYDSWPCDSFFLLPDAVLAMDAGAFRDDLRALDPVLSASLPEWPQSSKDVDVRRVHSPSSFFKARTSRDPSRSEKRFFTLLDNHEGLTVHSAGKGTILIGGGGDGRGTATSSSGGVLAPVTTGVPNPSASANSDSSQNASNQLTSTDPSQKDRSSGLCYKDREERVRQMRERQQSERQQKLEELKEQAAASQKFREQQETLRRLRLEDMRCRETDRRTHVEERRRIIEQAEQERRETVMRRSVEREQRYEHKRRQERSNTVFAFGSSTPRMLDPKENSPGYWTSRRATSTTNVNVADSNSAARRASECAETDLSRKRATSAHSLNRKPEDDLMTRSFTSTVPTAARRRTDLIPAMPPGRDNRSSKTSPRHRSPGVCSGTVTPSSSSRPTSALSQGSGGSQAILRQRASPRKPRPLSIAGTTPSSADKPRESISSPVSSAVASPSRESRPIERKSSLSNGITKLSRAKSVGSDGSTPSTPQKTPSKGAVPKRTPAQVKAENAAKKASERNKLAAKSRATPKGTPLQSPSMENKPLPGGDKKATPTKPKESPPPPPPQQPSQIAETKPKEEIPEGIPLDENAGLSIVEVTVPSAPEEAVSSQVKETSKEAQAKERTSSLLPQNEVEEPSKPLASEDSKLEVTPSAPIEKQMEEKPSLPVEESTTDPTTMEEKVTLLSEPEGESKTPAQKAADKPIIGYQSEEEYKAVLAEKRRKAREAKERELEMERQRKLEEEERERREEEEYLCLLEEQKKSEEERLKKAIIEAEKQREEDLKKKEEEEKQRVETEKMEQQKQLEAEDKLRKEEEERQERKSRVAAIMARTRGKGGPGTSTPTKPEAKTPAEEGRNLNDSMMSESFLANMSSSMTDSMIVQAIESHRAQEQLPQTIIEEKQQAASSDGSVQDSLQSSSIPESSPNIPISNISESSIINPSITVHSENSNVTTSLNSENTIVSFSDQSSQPPSDVSSQPLSDISSAAPSTLELSSQTLEDTIPSDHSQSREEATTPLIDVGFTPPAPRTSLQSDSEGTHRMAETHMNGNKSIPMETTPTTQPMDLLDSFTGINGINHNGVDVNASHKSSLKSAAEFDPFDPLLTVSMGSPQTVSSTDAKSDTTFDQIIDLNQTKLSNEDAVNCNPPPPIIAFEDNRNKKQTQDRTNNVPDLLL